jgi:hypothetical protein
MATDRSLSDMRAEFGKSPLIAMPIAGTIAWAVAGVLGGFLREGPASIALFMCTGAIFPMGVVIGRFTGEDLLGGFATELDKLFGMSILMANLVWAIAIPFWLVEPSSLPLSVGVLAGLMWVPLSWMIQHWVGLFHAIVRTVLVAAAWLLFPAQRFTLIPAIIVAVYLVSIVALVNRRRQLPTARPAF